MTEPYLQMTGITKSFPGVQALKGISFEAYPGEILALVGANGAGKSTLMNVLGGLVHPDEGEIFINGKAVSISSPLNAAKNGIAFVHQEMAILPTMSIADTMFITSFPKKSGLINYKVANENCVKALQRLGFNFDPSTIVRTLSPGDQQMVEIARALLSNPKIIIFDEPTSSLTSREKEQLFKVINNLKNDGTVVIYISHFLDEVFRICDRAIVLRNGETVGGGSIKELTYEDIVRLMIGAKQINQYYTRGTRKFGDTVMEVKDLGRKGIVADINFSLRKGEVVGLWGLLGSGRTEVARAVMGLDPIDGGNIRININGNLKSVHPNNTNNWIGMLTENRREEGLLLPVSVKQNMSLANLVALTKNHFPFISKKLENEQVKKYISRLEIKISSPEQKVNTLSGGNQQKVIVGRWLQKNPLIYIMDEPTRGLDVGAKADIRNIINELAESGAALLVISSEIDEMMAVSDRYLVMNRGRIVAELPSEATKEELMAAAAGAR
jgi:ABC-type sugar transport system ATPase subunit